MEIDKIDRNIKGRYREKKEKNKNFKKEEIDRNRKNG